MSYRTIVVNDAQYRWKVGSSVVEIRADATNAKAIIPVPKPIKRWGVICPITDSVDNSLRIEIFDDGLKAVSRCAHLKKYPWGEDYKSRIECVSLPDKHVSITPSWVKAQILANF